MDVRRKKYINFQKRERRQRAHKSTTGKETFFFNARHVFSMQRARRPKAEGGIVKHARTVEELVQLEGVPSGGVRP